MLRKLILKVKKNIFISRTPYLIKGEKYKVYIISSTKKCPVCRNNKLLLLRTKYEKVCTDCDLHYEWLLTKGQKPLISCSR